MRLVATGPGGTVRRLPLGGRVVIGRSAAADLALEGARVSRRHAAIEARDGRVFVEDLGSANGTRVGGRRTTGPVELAAGATVRIGEWEVAVEGERAASAGHARPAGSRTRRWLVAAGAVLSVLAALAWARGSARADLHAPPSAIAERGAAGTAAERGGASVAEERGGAREAAERGGASVAEERGGASVAEERGGASEAAERGGPSAAEEERGVGDVIRGAAARLGRWQVEVAGARLLLGERRAAGDWAGARTTAERLAELDPLDPELAAAREALATEEAAAAREAAARELEALGRDEEALAQYLGIPPGSWHHGRARDAARRLIRERLAPARRAECVDRLRAGRGAEALPACRRYLELTCHERLDEAVAAAVRRSERARREAPWACPAEPGAWLAAGERAPGDGASARAVRERYQEPAVADALLAHFRDGRTRAAREALERLAAGAPGDGGRSAGLAARLEELDGRLVEARARVLAGDLEAASAAVARVAAIEAELLSNVPPSPALAAARGSLAAALRERGDDHLALGRDGLAFAAFEKAISLSPADPAARHGLERLEARAADRLDGDPSCDAARAALSFTSPEGAAHGRARARLASPPCRGVGAF